MAHLPSPLNNDERARKMFCSLLMQSPEALIAPISTDEEIVVPNSAIVLWQSWNSGHSQLPDLSRAVELAALEQVVRRKFLNLQKPIMG
jgi:hypothetical protein